MLWKNTLIYSITLYISTYICPFSRPYLHYDLQKLILSRESFLILAYVVEISVSRFIQPRKSSMRNWIFLLFPTATSKEKTMHNQIEMQRSKYTFVSSFPEMSRIYFHIILYLYLLYIQLIIEEYAVFKFIIISNLIHHKLSA